MLSPEERKLVNAALIQLQVICDDAESVEDEIVRLTAILQRSKGPAGKLTDVNRVVIRQIARGIINSLANSVDTANAILEEF